MRQWVPMQLNNIAIEDSELAKELHKVNVWIAQASQALTTNAIETGQQPAAVTNPEGGGANVIVKEDGVAVSTSITTFDFGSGLDVSELPAGEANVTVDVTEVVGSIDHGDLAGLADDDHAQYILVAGSRAFTGDQSMGGFGFTNVDDVAGVAANTLELISTETDEATAEGHRINWDANVATPTNLAKTLSIGVTDDGDVYEEQVSVENHTSAVGTLLRILPGAGTRGMLGFGNAGLFPKAGVLFTDAQIRFRANARNPVAVQHDGLGPGLATWLCQSDTKEFRFNFDNGGSAAANTTDAALWRFRCNVAITRGTFFQIDNASTDLMLVDYLGNLTTFAGRVSGATRITGNTTLDVTHHNVFADTDGGAFTVTLPAGVAGTTYRIINSGSSANNLTITPDGAELLLGANSNFTLLDGDVLVIVYEATEGWW